MSFPRLQPHLAARLLGGALALAPSLVHAQVPGPRLQPPPPPGTVTREQCEFTYDGVSYAPEGPFPRAFNVEAKASLDALFAPCRPEYAPGTACGVDPLTPAVVDALIGRFPIQLHEWEAGWGAEHSPTIDMTQPFSRLLAGFRLLERHEGNPSAGFAAHAADFVATVAGPFHPWCSKNSGNVPPLKNETRVGFGALDQTVWRRAASYVHETRHHQGPDFVHANALVGTRRCDNGEIPNGDCCRQGGKSCDYHFAEWGTNSLAATFLASLGHAERTVGFFATPIVQADGSTIVDDRADDIVVQANSILDQRYLYDPGFRYVVNDQSPDNGLVAPSGTDGSEALTTATVAEGGGPAVQEAPMGHVGETACFLTRVKGKFEKRTEFVHIASTGGTDPQWLLSSGTSSSDENKRVEASARCIRPALPGTPLSVLEYDFDLREGGEEEFPLESASAYTCFLMGIRGGLRDSNDGAYLTRVGFDWRAHLRSSHSNADDYLSARFGCTLTSAYVRESGELSEEAFEPLSTSTREVYWGPNARGFDGIFGPAPVHDAVACALTGVRGQFDGNDEVVAIWPPGTIAFPTLWLLRTDERRPFHTVRGNAECFLRPGFSTLPE